MLDMSSFDAALKSLYTDEKIFNMVYSDNPLLALMPKMTNFEGKNLPIPIIYGNPQRRSANFAIAQANTSSSRVEDFVLVRNKDYSFASIDNETLEASKSKPGAFLDAVSTEIDGAVNSITRSLAISMYRNGSGSIGQNTTAATGTSIQLLQPEDVTNFEVGQELQFSTADGGGSVKSGTVSVVGLDRDTGILTVDALTAIAGGAGIAANDYIFQQGDYDSKIKGLSAWLPASTPSATPFFGVDRTSDATRLAGVRFDGSAMPIEEAIIGGINRVAREGGKPTHCFLNYQRWNELVLSLGAKVQYIDEIVTSGEAKVSFKGVMVHGPKVSVKVYADQNCPNDVAYLLQMDTWKLYSLRKAPHFINSDGLEMLRLSNADGVEARIGYYAQLGCRAPGFNARISLS